MRVLARCISAALLLFAPLGAAPAAVAAPSPAAPAPLRHSTRALPDQYIVTMKQGVDSAQAAHAFGVTPRFVYTKALHGFAARLDAKTLDRIRHDSRVAAVEENGQVSVSPEAAKQDTAASWGLDRIDQEELPLDGQFNVDHTGNGTTAFIVDTGIDYGHDEFGGRAVFGFDAVGDGQDGQDCNGHGTHVSGTVGGATFGVAREATLVSVRVLDCTGVGDFAGVIAGFDWVAQNAVQPAVLNASLGGGFSQDMNDAVNGVFDAGVLPVVAAGNSAEDACNVSPASAADAVAVGATDINDNQASFSNHGPCLSLFAPGVDIISAKLGGGSQTLSGTSMASPHVAGVALLYLESDPAADPGTVGGFINAQATPDVLNVDADSPNLLLYTGGL